MRIITKELALKIAKKLEATIEKTKGPHDIWVVKHNGKMIANFGVRRGSKRELGHDHIPGAIFLHPQEARSLGQCTMKKDEWVQRMIDTGHID